MKEKTKDLEKVGIGIATMFGVYWIYSIFIAKNLSINNLAKDIFLNKGIILYVTLTIVMFIVKNYLV